jgi:CheY-like chemotaxis protein
VSAEVRIVFLEDAPADAALVELALQKGGLAFQMRLVETRENFLRELAAQPPDVILSDHGLSSFDGFSALAVAREKCPRVPFFFVTNALAREMEIEKLAPGVTDYIQKNQLHLLAPAIRRVLLGMKMPRSGGLNDAELELLKVKLLALMADYKKAGGYLPICSNCKKIRDAQGAWLPPETYFKRYAGLGFTHGICPHCADIFRM